MEGNVTNKKIVGTVSGRNSVLGGVGNVYGKDGKSAYEIALANGFEGTEAEWLESLHGKDGADGQDGYTPVKGVDYFDGAKGDTGNPGVYLGSGDMPDDCNVQVDPNGEAVTIDDIAQKAAEIITSTSADPIVNTATGNPVVMTDSSAKPVRDLKVNISAIQSGTGDPSPDNIRPITGYNAVNLTVCGKNFAFDFDTHFVKNGEYVGKANTQSQKYMFYADLKQGEIYTVSCNQVNDLTSQPPRNTLIVVFPDGTRKYETDFAKQYAGLHSITFTANETGRYRFDYWVHTFSNEVTFNNFQLEVGAVATSYEPYRGETFTIDLGQTVYGGYVDWTSNKCVLTHKGIAFDGTEKWMERTQNSQGAYPHYIDIADCKLGYKTSICNMFANMNAAWDLFGAWNYSDHPTIARKYFNTVCATVAEWKAYLTEQYANGTPVQIVYELAEPIEYDLADLPSISTLYPNTTMYTDGSNIEVSYVADTKKYIDNKFNELATAIVANS